MLPGENRGGGMGVKGENLHSSQLFPEASASVFFGWGAMPHGKPAGKPGQFRAGQSRPTPFNLFNSQISS